MSESDASYHSDSEGEKSGQGSDSEVCIKKITPIAVSISIYVSICICSYTYTLCIYQQIVFHTAGHYVLVDCM